MANFGSWINLDDHDDQVAPFDLPWTVDFAFGGIRDYRDRVSPVQLEPLSRAVPKRQREFAAGRYLARRALQASGIAADSPELEIGRSGDRRPLWPSDRVGSISHTNELAWVAVSRVSSLVSLGIDLEQTGRLKPKLYASIFTEAEQSRYAGHTTTRWSDIVFSAKEAVFKAVNPLVGRYIGFLEVEVDLAENGHHFHLRYLGEHQPNQVMERGEGYVTFRDGHVLTLFVIPHEQRVR